MADPNNYAQPLMPSPYQQSQLNVSQLTFPPPQQMPHLQSQHYAPAPYAYNTHTMQVPQMQMAAQAYAQYPYAMAFAQPQPAAAMPAAEGLMAPHTYHSQRDENSEGSAEKVPVFASPI